jgi:hypothetical protein
MYCQFCGYQLAAGTNYCKQCGAVTRPLPGVPRMPSFPNTTGIAWAIAALGVGGLGVIFGTAIPLFAVVPNFGIVLMAMLLGFLVLSVGLGALIRHMQKITSLAIENSERSLPRPGPATARYLDAGRSGMASVTENTTRSFDYPVQPSPTD